MATIIPVDIVEALMGHEGYLTSVYRRYTQEDLAKKYLEAEHTVFIFRETEDLTKFKKEVEQQNKSLQIVINDLAIKNTKLEEKYVKLAKETKLVTDILRDLKPLIEKVDQMDEFLEFKRNKDLRDQHLMEQEEQTEILKKLEHKK